MSAVACCRQLLACMLDGYLLFFPARSLFAILISIMCKLPAVGSRLCVRCSCVQVAVFCRLDAGCGLSATGSLLFCKLLACFLLTAGLGCCLLFAVCCRLLAAGPAFPFFLFYKNFVVLTSLMNFGGFFSN